MGDTEDCVALLGRSDFFSGALGELSDKDIQAVAQAFRLMRYSAGQHIFSRGDQSDFLLLVAQGRVRLSVESDDGRELSVIACETPPINLNPSPCIRSKPGWRGFC